MINKLLEAKNSDVLSKKDLVIGTAIALVLGTTFTLLSSGLSLIVTFVPGVVVTWLTYVWLFVKQTKLPIGRWRVSFIWYIAALSIPLITALGAAGLNLYSAQLLSTSRPGIICCCCSRASC